MIHRQPDRKFDIRTLERNLAQGKITQDEYDTHLANLADSAPGSAEFQAQFIEGILEQKAAKARAALSSADSYDDDDDDYDDDEEE